MLFLAQTPALILLAGTLSFPQGISAISPPASWNSWPKSNAHGQVISPLWSGWGGDAQNNRWAQYNTQVNSASIKDLSFSCNKTYDGGVSATPTVGDGGLVYYPTWSGEFVALDYTCCKVKWSINVTQLIMDFAPVTAENSFIPAVSRTAPQINDGVIYFGTLLNALVIAADIEDGSILDTIQLNSNQFAVITQSPTWYENKLFIGASSQEVMAAAVIPHYNCCSFVGNMAALTFTNHKFATAWNISTIPDKQHALGWSGAAVWGSQPAIDVTRRQVFVGTGNVYSVPSVITECQKQTAKISAITEGFAPPACLPIDILTETVLAIDLDLGLINWARQFEPLDSWTIACGVTGVIPKIADVCNGVPGTDADFGMAPSFIPGGSGTPYGRDLIVAGRKNGWIYAMNAQTGSIFWSTSAGPAGVEGGLSWGIATDSEHAYFTAINSETATWELVPSHTSINNSAYGSVSLRDGSIVWETAAPVDQAAYNPPTVAGDIVLTGRTGKSVSIVMDASSKGGLIALNKATGDIVADLTLEGNFHGGIAVQDEYLLFGTGYSGTANKGTFYVAKVGS